MNVIKRRNYVPDEYKQEITGDPILDNLDLLNRVATFYIENKDILGEIIDARVKAIENKIINDAPIDKIEGLRQAKLEVKELMAMLAKYASQNEVRMEAIKNKNKEEDNNNLSTL